MARWIAGFATAVAVVGTAAIAPAGAPHAAPAESATMIIGLTQPWDTLNPTQGFAVPDFEVWNAQYAGLTTRAADDYSPQPGLAESWAENEPGVSYTYTLREGLLWSDGTPLTAEDVAWNVNTARDEEWANYVATVVNLTAEVVDERTVTITSSVPDPKLPTLEIYILPKHVWEPVATAGEIETYEGLDGVGSGPFVITDYQSEESLTMEANANFHGGQRPIGRIIYRYFSNPDAMVAALENGEIDAAVELPPAAVESLRGNPDIEVVVGLQGGFDEIAINAGKAPGQPHPALLDRTFRTAIAHAVDKEGATQDLWFGLAQAATAPSMGADLKWVPEIPADEQFGFDTARANAILDEAGYVDADGNGVREMPGGGDDIVLRHAVNTDGDFAREIGELFVGWMAAIGIGVQLDAYDQDQLFTVIIEGTYDTFYWGWVPYVDPNLMLSYFTEAELGNFNDANWTNPEYEQLYTEQLVEVDPARRLELVHQMVRLIYDDAAYLALWYSPDLQAYRKDRFEGFVRQPAEIGPVLMQQSSPSYLTLQPVGFEPAPVEDTSGTTDTAPPTAPEATTAPPIEATSDAVGEETTVAAGEPDDDGGSNAGPIAAVIGGVAVLGLGGYALSRRRKSADERE